MDRAALGRKHEFGSGVTGSTDNNAVCEANTLSSVFRAKIDTRIREDGLSSAVRFARLDPCLAFLEARSRRYIALLIADTRDFNSVLVAAGCAAKSR